LPCDPAPPAEPACAAFPFSLVRLGAVLAGLVAFPSALFADGDTSVEFGPLPFFELSFGALPFDALPLPALSFGALVSAPVPVG
jgi:hypothetical protein